MTESLSNITMTESNIDLLASQIPRIDISAPANAIDYHPALLAHADENNGAGGEGSSESTSVHIVHITQPSPPFKTSQLGDQGFIEGIDSDSESDLSELSDGSLSEESSDSDDSEMDFQAMSQAEQAEHECFGQEYKGPTLSDDHAARLLVLMAHASTCPCRHKLTKHRDVCMSTKYMMLHVRDCPGTTASFDVCPFPWCRKVKHLLYHLVSCVDPVSCAICSPKHLSDSLRSLSGLNEFRLKKHRQCILAAAKTARSKGVPLPNARPATQKPTQRKELDISRSVTQPAKPLTPQKIDTTAPMSVSAAQTTATLSSTSTKTATSLPTELVIQDQFEKAVVNKVEQRDVVATPPGENIVLNLKNSETEKEIRDIDDGKMSLDEVQANIAGCSSIDEAIAEALAKERSISAIGEEPGFVQENVQKSCESESSVSHVTETKVTPLVRREGDVKMDVEEITMLEPVECPGIETTDDAIDKAAVQPNTSAVPSDSPLWPLTSHAPLAAMGHTTRSIKEEPAYPSQVCVCPPGKAKQCDGVPSIRGIMNGEQPSMEDMPETSAIERRMSTELSSEALTAC